jgi:dolichol-phosphate mannosyltransferase
MFRRFLSFMAMILFRIIFPTRNVRDYTCGYRAYNVGIILSAFEHYGDSLISQRGFACMVDILLKLRAIDAIVTEVPLVLRYDRKAGASKMNVVTTIKDTLVLLAKRRFGNYE